MTLHAAKGLEFATVFIVGMEEGIFPHSRAVMDPQEMQEERRLAYVGVTRAKALLHLVYAQQRALFGSRSANQISRFIVDIPEDILDIHHAGFGPTSFQGFGWNNPHDNYSPYNYNSRSQHNGSSSQDNSPQPTTHNLQPGNRVLHSVFGEGIVLSVDRHTIEIQFDDAGHKKLDPDFARLIKVNGS